MKLLRSIGAIGLLALCSTTGSAQDNPVVPQSASGEEVYGSDYLPSPPTEEAVPLEPGKPAAGFQFEAQGRLHSQPELTSNLDRLLRRLPGASAPNAPLLRSIRRSNRLPRFRAPASEAAAEPLATPPPLKVHFVNVGQGAGTILEFPCHTAIIDSGGEYAKGPKTVDGGKLFADYLDAFFDARPERNRVIDLVITSHPHEDHLAGLRHISGATGANAYLVRNVIDNGQSHDKGSLEAQKAFRAWAVIQTPEARYSFVNFRSAITATGVSNNVIDPITQCQGIDPIITIFWGAHDDKLRNGGADWLNPNNHSLVVRVDYGATSFLFVGDLEDVGAKEMLREYEDNLGAFDVDVYHVSHHGAGNDTFDRFVGAMSPDYAIISMGTPEAQEKSTAWAYGHPRQKAIDVLQNAPEVVARTRPRRTFAVAPQTKQFTQAPISRAIYGTGWEGTIIMRAEANGTITIE